MRSQSSSLFDKATPVAAAVRKKPEENKTLS